MLPNLIIVGAMKSGTTSLHYYLSFHPQIAMSQEKELNFFLSDDRNGHWSKGIKWYEQQFSGSGKKVYGESSPAYAWYPTFGGVPQRMHSVLPDVKLIYIIRDPIERIVSHYLHNVASGRENRKISMAVRENKNYLLVSKYYLQIEQYLNYFTNSNILVLTLDELTQNPQVTLQNVFRFLGVDDTFYCEKFLNVRNQSRNKKRKNRFGVLYSMVPGKDLLRPFFPGSIRKVVNSLQYSSIERPVIDERTQQYLIENLKDDVDFMRKYTGKALENWNI